MACLWGGQTFLRLNDPIKNVSNVIIHYFWLKWFVTIQTLKMRSKVDAVYKKGNSKIRRTQKRYAPNMHNGFRDWLKKKNDVKLLCILKGLKSDMEKLTVLPHATTADVFPWQQCARVRHPKHWAGGRLNNGSHLCCVYSI